MSITTSRLLREELGGHRFDDGKDIEKSVRN